MLFAKFAICALLKNPADAGVLETVDAFPEDAGAFGGACGGTVDAGCCTVTVPSGFETILAPCGGIGFRAFAVAGPTAFCAAADRMFGFVAAFT